MGAMSVYSCGEKVLAGFKRKTSAKGDQQRKKLHWTTLFSPMELHLNLASYPLIVYHIYALPAL